MAATLQILGLVAALQVKHFIADGPLQTKHMVERKSIYGAGAGVAHAAIHAAGTALVLVVALGLAPIAALLALLDFVIHYHVDYLKENLVKWAGWTVKDGPFWWALSADQTLHQLTYLAITALALSP